MRNPILNIKSRLLIIALALMLLPVMAQAADTQPPAYEPGVVVVGLKEITPGSCPTEDDMRNVLTEAGIACDSVERLSELMQGKDYSVMNEEYEKPYYRFFKVILTDKNVDVPGVIVPRLESMQDKVSSAEANLFVAISLSGVNDFYYPYLPAPFFGQWSHKKAEASKGWDISTGNPWVNIAILDSGVDNSHQDLIDNKLLPWSATGVSLSPFDMHGSHVAGIAAAKGNNVCGVSGVCQNCKFKDFNVNARRTAIAGPVYAPDLVLIRRAIDHAVVRDRIKIINISIGLKRNYDFGPAINNAINFHSIVNGVIFVQGAGNDGQNIGTLLRHPCKNRNVICVAATDIDDKRWYSGPDPGFSSDFGTDVDVSAPGLNIVSTTTSWLLPPIGDLDTPFYDYGTGTSMATPYVSGLVGLIWSRYPSCSREDVKYRIFEGADAIDDGTGCGGSCSGMLGHGRVNVYRSLAGLGREKRGICGQIGKEKNVYIKLKNNGVRLNDVRAELVSVSAGSSSYVSVTDMNARYPNFDKHSTPGAIQTNESMAPPDPFTIRVSDTAPFDFSQELKMSLKGTLPVLGGGVADSYDEELSFYVTHCESGITDPDIIKVASSTSVVPGSCPPERYCADMRAIFFRLKNDISAIYGTAHAVIATLSLDPSNADEVKDRVTFLKQDSTFGEIPPGAAVWNSYGPFKISLGPSFPYYLPVKFILKVRIANANMGTLDSDKTYTFTEEILFSAPPLTRTTSWSWESPGEEGAGTSSPVAGLSGYSSQPVLVDFNNNGYFETVVPVPSENKVYCLDTSGIVRWSYNLDPGAGTVYALAADINKDGYQEIVLSEEGLNRVEALGQNGYLLWRKDAVQAGIPAAGNIDSDPELEIVLAKKITSNNFTVTALDANTKFWERNLSRDISFADERSYIIPLLGDVNNDGIDEIFADQYRFDNTTGIASQFHYESVSAVADINGDGQKELLSASAVIGPTGFPSLANYLYSGIYMISPSMVIPSSGKADIFWIGNDLRESKDFLFQLRYAPGNSNLELISKTLLDGPDYNLLSVYQKSKQDAPEVILSDTSGNMSFISTAGAVRSMSIGPGMTFSPLVADIDKDGKLELVAGMINPQGKAYISCTRLEDSSILPGRSIFTQAQVNAQRNAVYTTLVNRPPVLAPIASPIHVRKGETVTLQLSATDPDGEPITYSANNLPAGATVNPQSGAFSWMVTSLPTGPIEFIASDGLASASQKVTFLNLTPVLTLIDAASNTPVFRFSSSHVSMDAALGQVINWRLSATDPDGEPITYSATGLPAGATLNPNTGAFSWTVTGSATITFTASDGLTSASKIVYIGALGTWRGILRKDEAGPTYYKYYIENCAQKTRILTVNPRDSRLPPYLNQSVEITGYWHVQVPKAPSLPKEFIGWLSIKPFANTIVFDPPLTDKTVKAGEALTFTVAARGGLTPPLTYSASNLPSGAAFDPATQSFSWTPGWSNAGVYSDVRFRAADGGCASAEQNISITVTSPAPTGLAASIVSIDQLKLTWVDNAADEAGFKVERSRDGVTFSVVATVGANVTAYSNTGLQPNTTYYYRVRAYKTGFNSDYSAVVSMITPVLAAPTGLTASPAAPDQVLLGWTDNTPYEAGYKIERSLDGVTFAVVGSTAINARTYRDTGRQPETRYYYRVRALKGPFYSGYSNPGNAVTPAFLAPTGLTATAASSTSVKLVWTDNTTYESGYKIERSVDGLTFSQIATVGPGFGLRAWTNTGLTAGTTYYYRVRAYRNALNTNYSNTADIKL